ncbi:barstar family protein [Nonomuraea sp. NN258]|uniref:barstar family protein n=1 Tax=Nonomuraea antri TaxID=2730852 RepID=UPI0015698E86|nr:barstar family protein [Nonomuraea antri]NRQ35885.1 barstar family protein [Nonomuraea antri]
MSSGRPLPSWLGITTGPAPGDSAAATLDGHACRTTPALLRHLASALRLPAYFGGNWDALTDSLRDITSNPHDVSGSSRDVTAAGPRPGAVAVAVRHAEHLLGDEPPDQLATLLAVVADAAGTSEPPALTLTLHTDPAHRDSLRHRIDAALALQQR